MKQISLNAVEKAYRRYAPVYDRVFGAVLEPGRKALAGAVRKANPDLLLEVGVGTGLMLAQYPAHTRIVGIDISPEMLDVARTRSARSGPIPELQVMDAEQMAFPDNYFDCVTLPYVLSVTPNPQRLMSEVRRVCKKGGNVLIVNHFSGNKPWWLLEKIVSPIADWIGFRSNFGFDEITRQRWDVLETKPVNLFGLSRLVTIRNIDTRPP